MLLGTPGGGNWTDLLDFMIHVFYVSYFLFLPFKYFEPCGAAACFCAFTWIDRLLALLLLFVCRVRVPEEQIVCQADPCSFFIPAGPSPLLLPGRFMFAFLRGGILTIREDVPLGQRLLRRYSACFPVCGTLCLTAVWILANSVLRETRTDGKIYRSLKKWRASTKEQTS